MLSYGVWPMVNGDIKPAYLVLRLLLLPDHPDEPNPNPTQEKQEQFNYIRMYWSTEDTLKVIGLILFISPFVIAIRQLYKSADKLKAKREREKKSS
jgi:hypothetical protein